MAFEIIAELCIGCTACGNKCPVSCITGESKRLHWIDPLACIDCGACVPECPVEAIFYEDDVPHKWHGYIELNHEMAEQCPQITEKQTPLHL